MKDIIKFELFKIVCNKLFISTIIAFILLNVGVLIYQRSTSKQTEIPYSAYQLLNSKLKHLSENEKKELIQKEHETYLAFSIIATVENLNSNPNEGMKAYSQTLKNQNKEIYEKYIQEYANAVYPYTKDATKEIVFWEEIKKEFDDSQNYKGIIESILEKSQNLETISIFKDSKENKDNFSNQNIKDTATEYEKMLPTKIEYQVSAGINSFTKLGMTDILVIIFIFVIASIMILEEREKNLLTLIKSTKKGRTTTILSKIMVMFLCTLGIVILLYGINFIYYGITIGYGDINASLQSIHTFIYSILPITIGQYLMLFLGTKIIVFLIISLIILLISTLANNNVTTYITFIGILSISFGLYVTIEPTSQFNIFKYINIANFLETNSLYKTYFNLKIGGFMSDIFTLSIIFGIILLTSMIISVIFLFITQRDLQMRESYLSNKIKKITFLKPRIDSHVMTHEGYKLLITNKVAILLLVFIIFQIYHLNNTNIKVSFHENIYHNYMQILSGKLTEEKTKFIEEEEEKFRQAQNSIDQIEEKVRKGEISKSNANIYQAPYEEILSTQKIFNRVLEQYHYIKGNPQAEFVYDTGYQELLRVNQNSFLESDMLLMIFSIICFTSLFVMEYRTGMITILNTTPKGKRRTAKSKVLVCIIVAAIIFTISIIPEMIKIGQMYGFNNLTAPIISLACFQNLPVGISILGYMIIMYALRFMMFISIILLILWISIQIKNTTYTILIASVILVIPVILTVLGIPMAESFSVIPVLSVSKIILSGTHIYWLYMLIPMLIGIYCYLTVCKKFK